MKTLERQRPGRRQPHPPAVSSSPPNLHGVFSVPVVPDILFLSPAPGLGLGVFFPASSSPTSTFLSPAHASSSSPASLSPASSPSADRASPLKAPCMDLGFGFEAGCGAWRSRLAETFPALDLYYAVNGRGDGQGAEVCAYGAGRTPAASDLASEEYCWEINHAGAGGLWAELVSNRGHGI